MSDVANPSRSRILERIRTGLKEPAHSVHSVPRAFIPLVDDLVRRFTTECKNNYTECFFANGPEETRKQLAGVLESLDNGVLFAEDSPCIRAALGSTSRRIQWSTEGPAPESCAATITRAEALIAATGSLLVTSSSGGRGGSIVAPVHIVLAKQNQLLPDIESALEFASRNGLTTTNSFVGVITGCSRTADIEKLLVIGAHGPKRLVVIVES
jgi:L-lactate dehydrogenase complex protein LldG